MTESRRRLRPKAVRASLDRGAGVFVLTSGKWSATHRVEHLDRWLAFYRRMRDRKGGLYAQAYAPVVDTLEDLRREING